MAESLGGLSGEELPFRKSAAPMTLCCYGAALPITIEIPEDELAIAMPAECPNCIGLLIVGAAHPILNNLLFGIALPAIIP